MTEKKNTKTKVATTPKNKGIVKTKTKVSTKSKAKELSRTKVSSTLKGNKKAINKTKVITKPKTKKIVHQDTLLETIIDAVKDKKGKDIVSIDLRMLSGRVCDYFVICHADTGVHVHAITRGIEEHVRVFLSEKPFSKEGIANSQWVLLDYVTVVVHIMQTQYRGYYNLEGLWADAKILKHDVEVY